MWKQGISKLSRRFGFSFKGTGTEINPRRKRINRPGIHGAKRIRESEYRKILMAKNAFRYFYGIKDVQLRNIYKKLISRKSDGNLKDNLSIKAESRLDNVIFRSGVTNTRACARQLVSHKHFLVNGKKVNIPSYELKMGDEIEIINPNLAIIKESLKLKVRVPSFLKLEKDETGKLKIKFLHKPSEEHFNKKINTTGVVEWYSRRV